MDKLWCVSQWRQIKRNWLVKIKQQSYFVLYFILNYYGVFLVLFLDFGLHCVTLAISRPPTALHSTVDLLLENRRGLIIAGNTVGRRRIQNPAGSLVSHADAHFVFGGCFSELYQSRPIWSRFHLSDFPQVQLFRSIVFISNIAFFDTQTIIHCSWETKKANEFHRSWINFPLLMYYMACVQKMAWIDFKVWYLNKFLENSSTLFSIQYHVRCIPKWI